MIWNEIAFGRLTGRNTIGAFRTTGANTFWTVMGGITALCVSFFVLSYYGVIAGWTVGYIISEFTNFIKDFDSFRSNGLYVILLFAFFMYANIWIVLRGISGGIEKSTKIMMPMLFLVLFVLVIRSLTLEKAAAGLHYYLYPDFHKITSKVVLSALGQAFFSLSIGWGILITYGSYLGKGQNIVTGGIWVAVMDTLVALLAGFMIFPAVFTFGKDPTQGTALVFRVLPEIFNAMPAGGKIIGALFFLLLCLAALTSSISMVEVAGSWLIDEKKWTRKKATWTVGILAFIVGIPSALSQGAVPFLSNLSINFFGTPKQSFLDIMDAFFGTLLIVTVALMTSLYTGWFMDTKKLAAEISDGSPFFSRRLFGLPITTLWIFFIRYVCPLVIGLVLLSTLGIL